MGLEEKKVRSVLICLLSVVLLFGCAHEPDKSSPYYKFRYEMSLTESAKAFSKQQACEFRQKHLDDTAPWDKKEWQESLAKVHALILIKTSWSKDIFNNVRNGRLVKGMTKLQAYCSVGFPQSVRTGLKRGENWSQATVRGSSYLFFEGDILRHWVL